MPEQETAKTPTRGRKRGSAGKNSGVGMKKGWTQQRLRDVTTKIGSGATPRGGKASYKQSGISLIRSLNVHDGEFLDEIAELDAESAEVLGRIGGLI